MTNAKTTNKHNSFSMKLFPFSAGILALFLASASNSATIRNGSFEDTLGPTSDSSFLLGDGSGRGLSSWSHQSGTEVVSSGTYRQAADGTRSIYLSSGNPKGVLYQRIYGLEYGKQYELTFAMHTITRSSSQNSVKVQINSSFESFIEPYQSGSSRSNPIWSYKSFRFTADRYRGSYNFIHSQGDMLSLRTVGLTDPYPIYIDNLKISEIAPPTPAPVPLPASVLFLGGAVASLIGIKRKFSAR